MEILMKLLDNMTAAGKLFPQAAPWAPGRDVIIRLIGASKFIKSLGAQFHVRA